MLLIGGRLPRDAQDSVVVELPRGITRLEVLCSLGATYRIAVFELVASASHLPFDAAVGYARGEIWLWLWLRGCLWLSLRDFRCRHWL